MDIGSFSAVGGFLAVVVFFVLVAVLKWIICVCPPNHVLVVTGGSRTLVQGTEYGFRLQRGGWTVVWPYIQKVAALDLSIIPINVRVEGVNSANGITVGADATACVCVDHEDEVLLYSAVQRLMSKSRSEIQEQIQQTMVGNFRGALNKTTPLQAIGMVESVESSASGNGDESATKAAHPAPSSSDVEGERAQFRAELLRDSNQDLSSFGMRIVSVSLQKIWDTSDYIANLANKTLSRKRQEVEVEESRLRARAERAESDAQRRMTIAQNQADEQIIAARQELEVLRRRCEAEIERTRLEADGAIAQATSEGEEKVQRIAVELQKLKNVSNVTLEAEARRRAAETEAEGESQAVSIIQETRNRLLEQKAQIIAESGDIGRVALFVQQHLPALFAAYHEHASEQHLDRVVIMDDKRGINGIANRGPEAFVEFLNYFEEATGMRVRDFMSVSEPSGARREVRA